MDFMLLFSSFFLSFLLQYGIHKIFSYYEKFDDFNFRSSHNTLATKTGGIGIFINLLLISLYFYSIGEEIFDYSVFIPLAIMFFVGVYDDFYNANFKLKFFLQIIIAKIIIDQGFVIDNYYGFLGFREIPWFFAQITTVFIFLIIVNSINFIDGIDGLAITEVLKGILLFEFFSQDQTPFTSLSTIIFASIIPLYYFNFKKKNKVFLGDGGSLFFGTLLSIYVFYILGDDYKMNIEFQKNKVVFSILIVVYPLFDLLRVFIIRIKSRKSPFQPDQNHLHHYLYKRGYKTIYNLIFIEFISIVFVFIAFLFF